MTRINLNKTPDCSRLQSLAAGSVSVKTNRTAGKFGAGLLTDVSAITRGEALGHGYWIDAEFLSQVETALESAKNGSKCRFTHPGLSADGLAKGLGLAFGGRVQGDQILTNLHFYASAHRSPDGDLAGYVMDRADEDPLHFGTSIVFVSDLQAEKDFMLAHGGTVVVHDDGWETYETIEGFESPDPLNVANIPHCRLFEFLAVDVVDDPAANPNGLFHRDLSTIDAATEFLDYSLGLSDAKPAAESFGIDAERAKLFIKRYAAQRGITFQTPKGKTPMSIPANKLAADPAPAPAAPPADTTTHDPVVPENDMVTCPKCGEVFAVAEDDDAEPVSDMPQTQSDYAAAHGKYVAAFGADDGTKWFLSKMKFSDAQKLHFTVQLAAKDQEIVSLKAQLKTAQERLSAIAANGETPLSASPPPRGQKANRKGRQDFPRCSRSTHN